MVWRWDQILQTAPVWPLAGLRLVVSARDGMKSAEISGRTQALHIRKQG